MTLSRAEIDARYRARNPEAWKASRKRSNAKARAKDPEADRARCRARYAAKREQELARKRVYYATVRKFADKTDEGRFKDRDRKARRRAEISSDRVTRAEWDDIKKTHNQCCAYCGVHTLALEMDHVQPLTRGGRHLAFNIVPACKPCNSSKGNR